MDSKIEQLVCHLGQTVCLCGLNDSNWCVILVRRSVYVDSKIEQLVCHLGQTVCLCGLNDSNWCVILVRRSIYVDSKIEQLVCRLCGLKDRATGVSCRSGGLSMWTQR